MLRRYLYGIFAFVLATGILTISFLRLSSRVFAYSDVSPSPTPASVSAVPTIDYQVPQPGQVLPDNFLWPIKAIRDRIWYIFTTDHLRRAELALLFSDKRIVSGQVLYKQGKSELGISTIVKAEKYFVTAAGEEKAAREGGADTSDFLRKLTLASLKHKEIIERDILPGTTGQASSQIGKAIEGLDNIYRDSSEALKSMGKDYPKNPFEGQ